MDRLLKIQNEQQNYYVLSNDLFSIGQKLVIKNASSLELVTVSDVVEIEMPKAAVNTEIEIIREATKEDNEKHLANNEKKKSYQQLFKTESEKLELDMRLVDIVISLNNDKVTFYYAAAGRIDFRQLVKKLASVIRARIELRQLNERERAKYVGGLGPCGYELCCSKFLQEFETVNVKMAKIQQLSFNLQRVTGLCDRLLCCLKYENDEYVKMKQEIPDLNKRVLLQDGRKAKVSSLQLIAREITLQYDAQTIETMSFETFFTFYKETI